MRTRIAERLSRSKQTIPHFYISIDIDMSEALTRRRQHNQGSQMKVSVTDILVKVVASALSDFPRLNAYVEADRLIIKKSINVGVVVSVDDGLIVPVVPDADRKNIAEISTISSQNAEGARLGRLKAQAVGTFTISNLGMCSVRTFLPIINPPESGILGVGAVTRRPAAVDGRVELRDIMTLTLACDHRAIDGTYAAAFLERVRQELENSTFL